MTADAPPPPVARQGTDRRARRTLLLLVLVTIAPVAASYAIYYLFPRSAEVNYGTLLTTAPAPPIEGVAVGNAPFRLADLRGRWVLVAAVSGGCDAACERVLYATRQARTMQGKEQDRVVRVLLLGDDGAPSGALLAEHPGLVVVRDARGVTGLPGGGRQIVLVDPLGNVVLSYPQDPDIKGLAGDLSRLLRASRIG